MIIASWNVNSVRLRVPLIRQWLKMRAPDIVCLQELKCEEKDFPAEVFAELGYNSACWGQKAYNGVALLSKTPLEDVRRGLSAKPAQEEARYLEAFTMVDGVPLRVGGLYAPNGNPAPGPKFDAKLAWLQRLRAHASALLAQEEVLLLLGDYNIIPEPQDVHAPEHWTEDALFRAEARAAWRALLYSGFSDAVALAWREEAEPYTFWDYQGGAWRKNHGIRIDHALLSPQASDRLQAVGIDKAWRGEPKPSDHVPIWVELSGAQMSA